MEKSVQRINILAQLKKMTDEEYRLKSARIIDSLLADPDFLNAKTIGVTVSSFPEVDTVRLIEICWQQGKTVAIPKCSPVNRSMAFYSIESFDQLETVYMSLKEPIVEESEFVSPEKIDFMIVPGVVFSRDGYRIGFGGGYYDRYLSNFPGVAKSLAFSLQIADSIPVEEHDVPVEGIHTEKAYIEVKKVKE